VNSFHGHREGHDFTAGRICQRHQKRCFVEWRVRANHEEYESLPAFPWRDDPAGQRLSLELLVPRPACVMRGLPGGLHAAEGKDPSVGRIEQDVVESTGRLVEQRGSAAHGVLVLVLAAGKLQLDLIEPQVERPRSTVLQSHQHGHCADRGEIFSKVR
jgi:hypothetical protein